MARFERSAGDSCARTPQERDQLGRGAARAFHTGARNPCPSPIAEAVGARPTTRPCLSLDPLRRGPPSRFSGGAALHHGGKSPRPAWPSPAARRPAEPCLRPPRRHPGPAPRLRAVPPVADAAVADRLGRGQGALDRLYASDRGTEGLALTVGGGSALTVSDPVTPRARRPVVPSPPGTQTSIVHSPRSAAKRSVTSLDLALPRRRTAAAASASRPFATAQAKVPLPALPATQVNTGWLGRRRALDQTFLIRENPNAIAQGAVHLRPLV